MGNFITGIYVIRRESHIKARAIKIKTTGQRHIEETINLVNNGISAMLSSHSRTSGGYQIFLQSDADGDPGRCHYHREPEVQSGDSNPRIRTWAGRCRQVLKGDMHLARLILLGLVLLLASPSFASEILGKVVSILDGDTIGVLHNQQPERVRLSGIDCPEKGQAYGKRAKQAASESALERNSHHHGKIVREVWTGVWVQFTRTAVLVQ